MPQMRARSLLLAAALLWLPMPAKMQVIPTNSTPDSLAALLAPIVAERLEKLHVPGAAVAIVKDGKIIFTQGYGVADIEKKTPVIPDRTIFRIGSITKVFTATAVMQLADRKKINLQDDVNQYLKSPKIPTTFLQPITFAHLLTHTAGLDEISPGRRTSDETKVIPLGEFLQTRIVRRLPPGEIISYSTYNPALAALAVEQITGTLFKVYLQKNIFAPLGMHRTSITTVPKEYRQDLAGGYEYGNNKYERLPFQWFHTYPASDINSTAADMARFMLAHLQYGALDGQRIFSEQTARAMQATQFRNHPKIFGWAYGFYEGRQNNLRFIEHGGSMDDGYSALLTLVPEKKLGVFVACNTEGGAFDIGGAVKDAVFNHYFPVSKKAELPATKNPPPAALQKFAGQYRPIIYCHSCPPNTSYVFPPFSVQVTNDGMLAIGDERWKQIEPLLFVLANGKQAGQVRLGFKANQQGAIAYLVKDGYQVSEKIAP